MAMFERFSERAVRVIMAAQEEAKRLGAQAVGTEHLLLGMLKEGESIIIKTFESFGTDPAAVKEQLEKLSTKNSKTTGEDIPFSGQMKKTIEYAWDEARGLGHSYVGVEHLFLGMLRESSGVGSQVLNNLGLSPTTVKKKIISLLGGETAFARKGPVISHTPILDSFSRDLTQMSRDKKLDPVIGRNKEIERVIQILARRKKNNPVLTGEAGVGKTAIVEGLAQRIVAGDVPPPLLGKRVVALDLGVMIAGTKYRGEFEERMKKVLEEIRKNPQVIIFVDELHTLIGAGAAEGALDAANMLKPPLARGEIQCIGATTMDEYRKKIENDAALERRFQAVSVSEPSVDDTVEILKGLRSRYEEFHKVRITTPALVASARLSARYISERHLPDKAIDLMDEAASKVMLASSAAPPELVEITREIEEIRQKKEDAARNQAFEEAAALRDKEDALRLQYEAASRKLSGIDRESMPEVNEEIIAQVVSAWTGVPVTQLTEEETKRLLKMERTVEKRVVGQDEAVTVLAKSIRRARAGLKDPKRPVGSFLFMGPSGVGKTELAKRLAEFLFGDIEAVIRLDMSEYLESHTVSRLVGSPPGYVGFGEGGQLSEPVRRKPHSVVLLDEVEKAHPDVLNILLQILDDGRLTDSQGRIVDFKNTVVIMTSNVGAELIQKETTIGFLTQDDAEAGYDRMKEKILEEAKKRFKPEFLNRIDEMIVFHPLSKEDLGQIVEIIVGDVNERLKEKNISLKLNKAAEKFLVEKGYDPKFGARPLRRTIEDYIEDPLSEEILKGTFGYGSKIAAEVKDDRLAFEETAKPPVKRGRKKQEELPLAKTNAKVSS